MSVTQIEGRQKARRNFCSIATSEIKNVAFGTKIITRTLNECLNKFFSSWFSPFQRRTSVHIRIG